MKNWNVVINYLGNIQELKISAKSYSDAYLKAETSYPGYIVRSISEIPEANGPNYQL